MFRNSQIFDLTSSKETEKRENPKPHEITVGGLKDYTFPQKNPSPNKENKSKETQGRVGYNKQLLFCQVIFHVLQQKICTPK